MLRSGEHGLAEHQVDGGDADKGTGDLRGQVHRHLAPRQSALRGVRQGDGGVEVRSRNRPEREDQGYQHGARGDGIRQQGDGEVSAGQPFAHNSGADHRRQ